MLRIKPWEAYKAQDNNNKGLLAALSQEDLDRVSAIYFTQEQAKEEAESEVIENNIEDSQRDNQTGIVRREKTQESSDTPSKKQIRHV